MSLKFMIVFLSALNVYGIENVDPSLKGFDDSILFKINWPGKDAVPKEILDVPDFQQMTLTTDNDEKYRCIIPTIKEREKNYSAKHNGPNPLDLLVSLFKQSSCTHRLEAYWTYELCHGRYIRQYHEEREGKTVKLQEYFLGRWDKSKQEKLRKYLDEEQTKVTGPAPIKKIDGLNMPYLQLNMSDGTICDLNGKPRITNVLYICYVHGKHEIYSLKETSICEYEVIVLSPLLCEHPRYRPQETGENIINCHPIGDTPKKPKSLLQIEAESLKMRHQKTNDDKMQGVFAVFSVDNIPGEDGASQLRVEIHPIETEEEGGGGGDVQAQINLSFPNNGQPIDLAFDDFLSGINCVQGDAGWWKYEFCYGENVIQYHIERDGSKTVINLGNFIRSEHKKWLDENPQLKPDSIGKKQISHLYSKGTICASTGFYRSTEVILRCVETSYTDSVAMYLLERTVCQYTLVLESRLICKLLTKVDEYGLYEPLDEIGFSRSSYKNGYRAPSRQEEAVKTPAKDRSKKFSDVVKEEVVLENQIPDGDD